MLSGFEPDFNSNSKIAPDYLNKSGAILSQIQLYHLLRTQERSKAHQVF